jgi:hypothetical protein
MVQIGTRAYALPPTAAGYGSVQIDLPQDGRVELRCLAGTVNLGQMDHE